MTTATGTSRAAEATGGTLGGADPFHGCRESGLSGLLYWMYGRGLARNWCLRFARRTEGGRFTSRTRRRILRDFEGIEVGAYSYGNGLRPGVCPRGVSVGRYVSIAHGVKFFLRNHPMDRLSTHPYFFNRRLGVAPRDVEEVGTLRIEHDAWIGENVIVTPGCSRIGIGAVVGAGSVVTRDVEDFAIVAGNPAKLIRHRFDEATRQAVLESRWWERSIEELRASLEVVMDKASERTVREAFGSALERAS